MAEKSVELDSIELAAAIFGNCDQNVKLLENEFHVTAVCRGSLLKFTGEPKDVEAAVHAVDGMVTLMQNHTPLEEQTVRYCISLARDPRQLHHLWRGACRYGQNLSGCGHGGQGVQVKRRQPHYFDPPCRGSGGEAGLSARRFAK